MEVFGIPITNLGAVGLLGITVVMIFRGDLVPRKTHEREIQRGDRWEALSQAKDSTIANMADALKDSTEPAKFAAKVMEELQQRASREVRNEDSI